MVRIIGQPGICKSSSLTRRNGELGRGPTQALQRHGSTTTCVRGFFRYAGMVVVTLRVCSSSPALRTMQPRVVTPCTQRMRRTRSIVSSGCLPLCTQRMRRTRSIVSWGYLPLCTRRMRRTRSIVSSGCLPLCTQRMRRTRSIVSSGCLPFNGPQQSAIWHRPGKHAQSTRDYRALTGCAKNQRCPDRARSLRQNKWVPKPLRIQRYNTLTVLSLSSLK